MAAHPRRLLSWRSRPCRTPSSGCSSGNAKLARPSTGTDALVRLSGRHQLVSRSCGSVTGLRRESATGIGIRVSPLPPGRGASPPAQGGIQVLGAVPSLLYRGFLHREQWSLVLPSTWHTGRDLSGTAHTGFMGLRALPCGSDYVFLFPLRLFGGDGFSVVLTAYGPPYLAATCSMSYRSSSARSSLGDPFREHSRIQCLLVRQWTHICVSLWCSFAFQRNAWTDSGYKFASVYGSLSYSSQCLVRQWIQFVLVYGVLSYFSAMLGSTVDTYCRARRHVGSGIACRFAGYDDFALCSLRRWQARGLFTGAFAATVPAAYFASWDEV